MDIKGIFRGLALSILGTALVFCLFFIAYSLVFNLVTANREKVKTILDKSSLYENLPGVAYDNLEENSQKSESTIPLEDPKIRQIALNVFNPAFFKENMENLIDGSYDWLEGKSEQLVVAIELKDAKKRLADGLGNYAEERLKKLPACNFEQLQRSKEFDIFRAKCLPPGVNFASIQKELDRSIKNSGEIPDETAVKSPDGQGSGGQSGPNNLARLPETFSTIKWIPLVLLAIAAGLVYWLLRVSKDKISGYKRISRLAGVSGLFIFLTPIIALIASKSLLGKPSPNAEINEIALSIIQQFMAEAGKIYYAMGIILIAGAVALYIYARKLQAKNP